MAKNKIKNKNKVSGGGARIFKNYIIIAVVYAIMMSLNLYSVNNLNHRHVKTQNRNNAATRYLNSVECEIVKVNRDVVMLISNLDVDKDSIFNQIDNSFEIINKSLTDYEKMDDHLEIGEKRFNQAKLYIKAFEKKIYEYKSSFGQLGTNASNIYFQEISPYQISALEMFDAVIQIGEIEVENQLKRSDYIFKGTMVITGGYLIVGEIVLILAGRAAKKTKEEAEIKAKQAAAIEKKFQHSKAQTKGIAYTNILTGTKNRYALDKDITPMLAKEQMNLALFDIDAFKEINDIYGYDFGDEYLAQISETLKKEYGEFAEIYSITGNEIFFLFNRDVTDMKALKLCENIHATISRSYTVNNLIVQRTVSGCTYHYLAGDCTNLNALLIKMDNVIRNVKINGGNAIYPVMGI